MILSVPAIHRFRLHREQRKVPYESCSLRHETCSPILSTLTISSVVHKKPFKVRMNEKFANIDDNKPHV